MAIITLEIERSFRHRIVTALNVAIDKLRDEPDTNERTDDAYDTLYELLDEIVEQEVGRDFPTGKLESKRLKQGGQANR